MKYDYIDRIDLLENIEKECNSCGSIGTANVMRYILNAPSITFEHSGQWIDVKKLLPIPGIKVIVCRADNYIDVECFGRDGLFENDIFFVESVTHWMPIPKPPIK